MNPPLAVEHKPGQKSLGLRTSRMLYRVNAARLRGTTVISTVPGHMHFTYTRVETRLTDRQSERVIFRDFQDIRIGQRCDDTTCVNR